MVILGNIYLSNGRRTILLLHLSSECLATVFQIHSRRLLSRQYNRTARSYLTFSFFFPDGRVEEKVVGVKGQQCLEVTRELNQKLGNVISTQPTEEMYEEEIQIEETVTVTENEGSGSGGGDGSTSWEGSSSW